MPIFAIFVNLTKKKVTSTWPQLWWPKIKKIDLDNETRGLVDYHAKNSQSRMLLKFWPKNANSVTFEIKIGHCGLGFKPANQNKLTAAGQYAAQLSLAQAK